MPGKVVIPEQGSQPKDTCQHLAAGMHDWRCPSCLGFLRRCCQSVMGQPHAEFCPVLQVRWSFEIEGQPVSWNAAYRIGQINRREYNREPHAVRTIVKTDAAKAYTELARIRANERRPSGWAPKGLVVVEFKYYLGRDIDCDNVMKLVNDGLAAATGVDDKWFLPRAMSKTTGLRPSLRHMEITVEG